MKLIKFIKSLKGFYKFYKDYNYDAEDLRFIVVQYGIILLSRTHLDNPMYSAREVIAQLDEWYGDKV